MLELRTERLLLRAWRDRDLAPFAVLNADPEVMEHFPKRLSREESDKLAGLIGARAEEQGWGLWAAELAATEEFIGFVGLSIPAWEGPVTPCVEVGWRLARSHWGHGYATEAARASLEFGFGELGLAEIIAMTVPANLRSQRVMTKLGMVRDVSRDFDHPLIPEGHPLRAHIVYVAGNPSGAA